MVKIIVGPDQKLWVLPEQLLCDRVKYFKSAFQSGFRESDEKVLELPEDCPVAFAYIIDRILRDRQPPTKNFGENQEYRQMTWCKLYVLADKLGCSRLVDAERFCRLELWGLRDECIDTGKEMLIISPAATKFLYDNTTDSAEMRQNLAEFLAERQMSKTVLEASQLVRWLESATSHPKFHFNVMEQVGNHYRTSVEDLGEEGCT